MLRSVLAANPGEVVKIPILFTGLQFGIHWGARDSRNKVSLRYTKPGESLPLADSLPGWAGGGNVWQGSAPAWLGWGAGLALGAVDGMTG